MTLEEPKLKEPEGGEEYWHIKWVDVPPTLIDFHRRLVSIEYSEDGVNGSLWKWMEFLSMTMATTCR